jgi:hypothetical protein
LDFKPGKARWRLAAGFLMLKNLQRNVILWIQARTGLRAGFFVWLAIGGATAAMAFVFLCVAGYAWLCAELGPVFSGLAMAGTFLFIAVVAATASAIIRRRTKRQATLERAATRARMTTALIDPKVLRAGLRAGRSFGWQRVTVLVLLGFLAAQWARESRGGNGSDPAI